MSLSSARQKFIPIPLLTLIFLMIFFFAFKVGDPTKQNISNNNAFDISTAYLLTPVDQQIVDVLSNTKKFTPSKISNVPWSFEQQAYWLKIVVKNKQDKEVNLVSHFDNPMLDELSIFQVQINQRIVKQQHQGDQQDQINFKQRIISQFKFDVSALDETTLYVRIATSGIANTPINIYKGNEFSELVQKKHLLWGIFIGVSIVIGLYNLLLYFAIKDVVYLIYNGYIFSIVALQGVVLGYGYYLFPEPLQIFLNLQVISLNCLTAIFVLLFLIYFLKFQIEKKWYYWVAILTISILSVLFFAGLWLPENISAPLFFMFMPVVYVISLILLFTRLRSGLKWGKFYIYSWIPLLIGAAMQPLLLTGYIEYNFISHHAFMMSVLVEIVLMAMALADRMRFQEEQVIYHATHESKSGLPNLSLLESHISNLLHNNIVFSTCLIEIENYQTLAPFLPTKELQKLQKQVADDIFQLLNEEKNVSAISTINGCVYHLAKVADGRLMFIFNSSDKSQLNVFLDTLQSQITKELQLNGLSIEINIRIGVCFQRKAGPSFTANEFIQHSLVAIEQNKESGERLHYYHDFEVLHIKEHLTLACDLQKAIRENQLQLYHQPQVNLDSGSIYGSEVLLRWNHPIHGFISPELFVRMAEDMGLINELTRWVIKNAFQQLSTLLTVKGLTHRVSINISGKDIGMPNFLIYIKEMMVNFNVPHDVVTFELTESVMVTDFTMLDSLVVALSELGINISIDDYGTGYSSLSYISQLKFDELKIDKAFVLDLDRSERNLTIVKTTIEMAKNLQLKVVAEGVESKLIEDRLIESGCDIGQGYYYTRPLRFDKYLLWLESYNKDTFLEEVKV